MCDNKQTGFTHTPKFGVTPKGGGFTLLELLLVVAMMGLIATFGMNLSSSFIWRTDLSQSEYLTVTILRRAQVLAQAQANDTDWGVHISGNQLTLFGGNTFSGRDTSIDEEYGLGSVTISSPVDVIYHKFSGEPYNNSTTINLATNQENATLTINEVGVVNY
jgi:prepilin-type N-terminal cleavage/methylation domain-containing protein